MTFSKLLKDKREFEQANITIPYMVCSEEDVKIESSISFWYILGADFPFFFDVMQPRTIVRIERKGNHSSEEISDYFHKLFGLRVYVTRGDSRADVVGGYEFLAVDFDDPNSVDRLRAMLDKMK